MSERWFCEIDGEAWVTRHDDGSITWERADERIHVAAELADNPNDYKPLWERYEITEWCPLMSAYHAHRKGDA